MVGGRDWKKNGGGGPMLLAQAKIVTPLAGLYGLLGIVLK